MLSALEIFLGLCAIEIYSLLTYLLTYKLAYYYYYYPYNEEHGEHTTCGRIFHTVFAWWWWWQWQNICVNVKQTL